MYLNFTCFILHFFNVATRKFKITYVARIIYLLGSTGLELHRMLCVQNHLNLTEKIVPAHTDPCATPGCKWGRARQRSQARFLGSSPHNLRLSRSHLHQPLVGVTWGDTSKQKPCLKFPTVSIWKAQVLGITPSPRPERSLIASLFLCLQAVISDLNLDLTQVTASPNLILPCDMAARKPWQVITMSSGCKTDTRVERKPSPLRGDWAWAPTCSYCPSDSDIFWPFSPSSSAVQSPRQYTW